MESPLVKTDDRSYGYDVSSSAFINTDEEALLEYRAKVNAAKEKQEMKTRLIALEARVAQLEEMFRKSNNV